MDFHHTDDAPKALGPYSQAVSIGPDRGQDRGQDRNDLVFTSGQVGIDPATGELVEGFEAQVRQVLANLTHVLASAGCSLQDVVKTTIYLTDMAAFPVLNEIYGDALGDHRPARSTVEVSSLPKGALVEIDFVARKG
ncbi:MAG: Rid family detoxifying hydrolase [Acidobacteriota bacterium]|jgi:2-iminobutanoate/2-iminopropanoate deaminase